MECGYLYRYRIVMVSVSGIGGIIILKVTIRNVHSYVHHHQKTLREARALGKHN